MQMKFPRKAIIVAAITLTIASGSYVAGRNGLDLGRAITESRCSAGAFVHHSDKAEVVAADSDTGDAVTSRATTVATPVAKGAKLRSTEIAGADLVPNGDVEDTTGISPYSWSTNIYGKNNATFGLVPGHGSANAVRTAITNYTDGDADWYYNAVKVQPGGYYRYSDYYRSDVSTRAILMLRDAAGHTQYINLKVAAPASGWTQYQASFFIPKDVTEAMVFHPLAGKGFLETDDFSLEPATVQGFSRPIVTLTFDDGWRSIHDNALPLMQRYNIASTQYIISGYVGQEKDYVTPGQLYDFRNAGHEIASHTVDHADLTKQKAEAAAFQLERSDKDLTRCYGKPTDFAPPYGAYNAATTAQVQKNYQTSRSTDVGFNTADNLDPYGLMVQNMTANTSAEQLNSWLETARVNHAWLILVYHQIDNGPSSYARHPADFEHDLQAIKVSGLTIETMHQAYTEIKSQVKP
ncbi:MAG: polysaccharide deacetylase family protein [Patescibacteria group bacterium]|nr:polysaccharide deacetylase family protein [Patescibacteria group bacterium]